MIVILKHFVKSDSTLRKGNRRKLPLSKMDKISTFVTGNLLLAMLLGTVLLFIVLFLFYLHCIVKSYILKRKHTRSSTSSFASESGLSKGQPISLSDLETETTILVMPHQEPGLVLGKEQECIISSNFFRLPSDRRNSYFKFNSVDELNVSEVAGSYKNRSFRSVAYFGRKGCRLLRKGTWDTAMARIWMNNKMDNENKEKCNNVVDQLVCLNPAAIHGYHTIIQSEIDNFQTNETNNNKEVLI